MLTTASNNWTDKDKSQHHRELVNRRQSELTKAGQEAGPIPPPANQARRDACKYDLKRFIETYLISMFATKRGEHRPWSQFHLDLFAELQESILSPVGGQFGAALPRGSVKTTSTIGAVIWASCYRHKQFAAAVCAADDKADTFLETFKLQFEVQPLLLEDFPEICIPVRHLERKTQKCKTQTVDGVPTRIEWSQEQVVLPTVAGSEASGFRFVASGLEGSKIRGLLAATATGSMMRPDLAIIDDPQTDDSARSVKQCEYRLSLIDTVMGMAGPGEPFTAIATMTVIREGDVAETILNNPDWLCIRLGIIDKMPEKEQLQWWNKLRDVQLDAKNRRLGVEPVMVFYREHQQEIEGDLKATWPARFNPSGEVSAIHHAINLYFKFPDKFMSDYMNKPKSLTEEQIYRLDPLSIRQRLTLLPRGRVPLGYDFLTIGVDIQMRIIWYVVMAWKMDMTGSIIDYGTFPKQRRREFGLDDLDCTLQSESGAIDADIDAAVSFGLMQMGTKLIDQTRYLNEAGLEIHVKSGQIDINYRASENAVGRFCRTSKWKSIFTPAMGMAMTKTQRRISEWKDKMGQLWPDKKDRRECEWMGSNPKDHGCREIYFDGNHWKTWTNTALSLPMYSPGSLSIYGEDPDEHRQLSAHFTSHYPIDVEINGVYQTQWSLRPGVDRDDLLDCVDGCAVAASRCGARLSRITTAIPRVNESPKPFGIPAGRKNLRGGR